MKKITKNCQKQSDLLLHIKSRNADKIVKIFGDYVKQDPAKWSSQEAKYRCKFHSAMYMKDDFTIDYKNSSILKK